MKNLHKILGLGIMGFAVFAQQPGSALPGAPISARTEQASTQKLEQPTQKESLSALNKVSSVIGMTVKESGGKEIGKVQDLVLDLENGSIGYAVVTLGANRLVPVPITALIPAPSKDHFVLNISATVLAAAPSVTNDEWPSVDTFSVGAPAGSEKGQGKSTSKNESK